MSKTIPLLGRHFWPPYFILNLSNSLQWKYVATLGKVSPVSLQYANESSTLTFNKPRNAVEIMMGRHIEA